MKKLVDDSETVISVENVFKEFKEQKRDSGLIAAAKSLFKRDKKMVHALKNANLTVKKGEVIGLIGPNGAGKSTLIKIMTGVLFPTSGKAKILGYVPWEDRTDYVQNIGVIFGQKSQLWWDIPAMDTFELHKDLYGIPENEFRKRVNYMIEMLDLEELVKKPVRQLSLGERMKCELILALLHNPKLVFLDEPTIGLDIISKDKIRFFVKDFNKRYGTTFLITTHDMSDIEKLCKRVVIINHGQIIYDGLLEEIRKRFANKKIIDCKFSDKIESAFRYKGCEVIKSSEFQMVLEVDLTKCKIKDVISHLIEKYGDMIEDIDIEETPVEEIIKEIYKLKKSIQ